MCSLHGGDLETAEKEFTEGIALAESVGEVRVAALMKGNYAVLQALRGRFDEALQTALENFEQAEASGLLYSRFEGHRCLAEVRRQRGELDEAEAVCVKAFDVVSKTESRVSRLWLGPVYIGILLESAKTAATAGNVEESETQRAKAKDLLLRYQKLVDDCQSPRFSREAERLATLIDS